MILNFIIKYSLNCIQLFGSRNLYILKPKSTKLSAYIYIYINPQQAHMYYITQIKFALSPLFKFVLVWLNMKHILEFLHLFDKWNYNYGRRILHPFSPDWIYRDAPCRQCSRLSYSPCHIILVQCVPMLLLILKCVLHY